MAAFKEIQGNYQLVIAGDADHETEYSRNLKKQASQDDRVTLTGYVTGADLNEVFTHARLFAMPSYHEGLPIALLEAMSYELPVLVSDIPANLEVDLAADRFFRCGDIGQLRDSISALLVKGLPDSERADYKAQLTEKYNWLKIAEQTVEVYEKVVASS